MTLNDYFQIAGVVVAIAISIGYIVRKIAVKKNTKRGGCGNSGECSGCPIADKCSGHHKSGSCGCC